MNFRKLAHDSEKKNSGLIKIISTNNIEQRNMHYRKRTNNHTIMIIKKRSYDTTTTTNKTNTTQINPHGLTNNNSWR